MHIATDIVNKCKNEQRKERYDAEHTLFTARQTNKTEDQSKNNEYECQCRRSSVHENCTVEETKKRKRQKKNKTKKYY